MQTYDAFLRMTKSIGVYSKILITIFIIIRHLCIKYRGQYILIIRILLLF